MSDEATEAKPEAKPAGPGTPKVLLVLLVLNLAATGFVVFKVLTTQPAAAATHHEVAAKPDHASEITGPLTAFDPFVVNLDEPGNARYLKVTLNMELASAEVMARFEKSKQLVRDAILSHLSGLKVSDTLGAAAKDKLRDDLRTRVEKLLGERGVKHVFFQEFMVQ